MTNDTGTDERGHDVKIISRDEYKRLKDCEEHLEWLVNLHHGVSKGGPDYSPPSDAEWEYALVESRRLVDGEA